jgi:uncharacterized membrane protein
MRYSTKRLICIVALLVLTLVNINFIQSGRLLNWQIEGNWYLFIAVSLIILVVVLICMAIYYDYKDKKESLR